MNSTVQQRHEFLGRLNTIVCSHKRSTS